MYVTLARGAIYLFTAWEAAQAVAPDVTSSAKGVVKSGLDYGLPEAFDGLLNALLGSDGSHAGPEGEARLEILRLRQFLEGQRPGGPLSDWWDTRAQILLGSLFMGFSPAAIRRFQTLFVNLRPEDMASLHALRNDTTVSVVALCAAMCGVVDPAAVARAFSEAEEAK